VTRVLVFYPSNDRSVAIETMMLGLHRRGVEIELLTTCEAGPLHEHLVSLGIPAHAHPVPRRPALIYYLRQAVHLVRFTRARGIDVVFSHLQQANIVAVLVQFAMKARVVPFRHHFDFVFPGDPIPFTAARTELLFDRIINRLSSTIVVPSEVVAAGIERVEHVPGTKLKVVRYVYDFDGYDAPQEDAVEKIRAEYPAHLTLLMVSRLIPLKRPELAFRAVRELVGEGLDIRLLVLGDGPSRASLEAYVAGHQLQERIVMLGYRTAVVNYMGASDLLVHPSLTEASCNAVKEMALLGKPAIVCSGVGDFSDYVEDGRNGFVLPRRTEASDLAAVIRRVYADPAVLASLGAELRVDVLQRFGASEARIDEYVSLLGPGRVNEVPLA
jgi:glycosyltransferase involved in cell wall biosynthesis